MQKIKPAEVSALLKKQLESANIQSSFDEIGTVPRGGVMVLQEFMVFLMLSMENLSHLTMVYKEWY